MKKLEPPWIPKQYELGDIAAVQAVARGTADKDQQQRALKWIVEQVCGTYDLGWHPEFADFAAGLRFAGLQIVKATKLNTALMRKDK